MLINIKSVEDFKKEIKSGKSVVDFFATWCAPCKMMSPIIDELSKEFSDVKFLKVDIDIVSQLASEYNVFSVPTFLFIKDGEIIKEQLGGAPYELFKKQIETLLETK